MNIDPATLHNRFKGFHFKGTNYANIETGEVEGYTIICKPKGGQKWSFIGSAGQIHHFESLKTAKENAKALNEWAKQN